MLKTIPDDIFLVAKGVLPVWQPVGFSTHEIARMVSEHFKVKTSHTGTLDPMAEGVVIVLLDEVRLQKYEFAKWQKEYVFEIAFGVSTDSFDGLGILVGSDFESSVDEVSLREIVGSFKGFYEQDVPILSAIKVRGKALHEHFRKGTTDFALPKRSGEIYEIDLLGVREVPVSEVVSDLNHRVSEVSGDFRQQVVLAGWEGFEKKAKESGFDKFQIAKIRVKMSKGLYIRSLSQDICKKLGVLGFTFSIVRKKNGVYGKDDCFDASRFLD